MQNTKTKVASKRSSVVVSGGEKDRRGREVYRIISDGQVKTVVTSTSSLTVMDKALAFFAPALKRLADQ